MIGKIMSEASHSIIGMLSAKPLDMETRTANNEFSSLLLPGENRSSLTLDYSGADTAEDNSSDQFLAQLIGSDDQPAPPLNDRDVAKAIAANISIESNEGDTELPSDTTASSGSVSEIERFISFLQPSSGESATVSDEGHLNAERAGDQSKRSLIRLDTAADADIDQKAVVDTDAETIDPNKNIGLDGKTPLAPSTPSDVGSERKIRDSLDLRLANKGKVEDAASRKAKNFDVSDLEVVVDEPMKIETKLPLKEMENFPAAGHLERNIELSGPANSAPVLGRQNAAARTVSFDWNAPQFAERFASEISDLTISGDLKKFEINPRNLGRLEVSLISRGGSDIIQIETENEAVREMIAQNSQAIQDMLKGQGRSDLTLRVDVRENMSAAPQNDSMNFAQQDSTEDREKGSASFQNRGTAVGTEIDIDPQGPSDNSRYA